MNLQFTEKSNMETDKLQYNVAHVIIGRKTISWNSEEEKAACPQDSGNSSQINKVTLDPEA